MTDVSPGPGASSDAHNDLANAIRALSMDAVEAAKSGHPGAPMGLADVATVLFTQFLKYDAATPDWADRDRFVLSAGHGSMLIYALAYLTGYPGMTLDEIRNFRQLGSKTAGHPEYGHAPGVETTTGPLGQGLATAVGMAIGEAHLAARYGQDLVDHYTYVIAGDGCLMEGISQEAIALAGHLKLGKLIVLFDDNGITIDGAVSMSDSTDQAKRFEASGWDTQVIDGHDPAAIAAAITQAKETGTPSLICCKTVIGNGAPKKAGTAGAHGSPLGPEEIAGARQALGWGYAPFEVPETILNAWRAAGARGAEARGAWEGRLNASSQKAGFEAAHGVAALDGLAGAINAFKKRCAAEPQKVATRKASQMVLEAVNEAVPATLGGSADLTGSNNTKTGRLDILSAENYGGRYLHYGIREHGMAAAMNGLALHGGVIPYGGTFLVFTDYCRPAIRLSALMEQRVIYVMTHDSIGLGEDGPTHQPVEHVASLRAMPNVNVYRPADIVETAECWDAALRDETTPSIIALTRQGLAQARIDMVEENLSAKGAYELRAAAGGKADVTIFATGSEVEIALTARDMLQNDGVGARVVSVPCWELFEAQSDDYKAAVLGNAPVRVAVEAGVGFGWERFVGTDGAFVGMTGFGASAPAKALYEHFGITADAVVKAAKARL